MILETTSPKETYRERLLPVINNHGAQARRNSRLLDRLVERPDLEHRLDLTSSLLQNNKPVSHRPSHPTPSSTRLTYRDGNQQTRPLHLPHMRDCDCIPAVRSLARRRRPGRGGFVRREAPHHLPARPDDPHNPVISAEEQAVRAGADGRDLVGFEEGTKGGFGGGTASLRVVGLGDLDLGCVEEVEGSPLFGGGGVRLVAELGIDYGEGIGRTVNAMVASLSRERRCLRV